MQPSRTLDLLLIGVGAAFALAGMALLLWALRGDRARGRVRCPRCWYNLQGAAGLRCPECGHTARSEAHTRRTRRRWRAALLATLVLALGTTTAAWPFARSSTWPSLLPGSVLVRLAPVDWLRGLSAPTDPLANELARRFYADRLTPPQCTTMFDRLFDAFPSELDQFVWTRPGWPAECDIWVETLGTLDYRSGGWASAQVRLSTRRVPPQPFVQRTQDSGSMLRLGVPDPNRPLRLDIEIWSGEEKIYAGTRTLKSQIGGNVEDILAPQTSPQIDQAVLSYLEPRLLLREQSLGILFSDRYVTSRAANDLAFGYRFDLLRNGEPVASTTYAHDRGGSRTEPGKEVWIPIEWTGDPPSPLDGASWSIRVRGDAHVALRDFARQPRSPNAVPCPEKYWAGEFTVPITAALVEQ